MYRKKIIVLNLRSVKNKLVYKKFALLIIFGDYNQLFIIVKTCKKLRISEFLTLVGFLKKLLVERGIEGKVNGITNRQMSINSKMGLEHGILGGPGSMGLGQNEPRRGSGLGGHLSGSWTQKTKDVAR